jgi:hypothetical protein
MRLQVAVRICLMAAASCLTTPGNAGPETQCRVTSVSPEVRGPLLFCRFKTSGLPSERAVSSMRGGLPASADFILNLLDDRDEVVADRRVSFRLAFDLWEEAFHLSGDVDPRRFESLDSLRSALAEPLPLSLTPLSRLDLNERYRIQVSLVHHLIAPAARERVGEWISGEGSGTGQDPDGRQTSFGLGSLIRFFYGRSPRNQVLSARSMSERFRIQDLTHERP